MKTYLGIDGEQQYRHYLGDFTPAQINTLVETIANNLLVIPAYNSDGFKVRCATGVLILPQDTSEAATFDIIATVV